MRIIDRSVYLGPSVYALFPVIRLELELGELEAWPSVRLGPEFVNRLLDTLPGLREHGCSYGVPGGFVRRLTEDEGTWLGHVLEHVAIELQALAGHHVTFGKTREADRPGLYHVVYEYEQETVGLEAGNFAMRLLRSLLPPDLASDVDIDDPDRPFDFAAERDSFIRFAQRRNLGPSTMSVVRAAEERDIPWIRLNDQSLIQFGHGKYQQRIQATVTSRTSNIAVELASDKEETNKILGQLGLPVPQQRLVQREGDAVSAADRIGYPVVLKPYNGNHGRAVAINLTTADQVRAAFHAAQQVSRSVIVEKFITGHDHRMVVIDGRLVAASRRVPGHVVGDGQRTIAQLVEEVNKDPRRGVGHEKVLTRIEFDEQADRLLAARGYTRDSIPAPGEEVFLRSTANLSTGGTAEDVTDIVHPDNAEMAVRAIKAIGLDVGGVDFLSPDISESYKEVGGGICEVNAAPGFRMHLAPSSGKPRDVAGATIDMLFPKGSPSTIPIAAITGTNGKTTTARMLAHILKLAGHTVGLTSTDGVYIDGQRTVEGDMTGPVATRMVLSDPFVDVAVLEIARGGLLRAGMGVRHCDVGAVLNVQSDHLGLKGIDTLEELARVKRIIVETARDTAVLNADDPLCLRMADYTDAKHLCYVTMNPQQPLVREHISAGGRGVVLESGMKGQMITIYDHHAHIPLLWTHVIPATLEGRALHNVQNAMFAAALAFSMGIKLENIKHGLRTFDTSFFQAPGRMNVFDEHPFKVIFDYGHNAHAVGMLVELAQRLEPTGQRIVVLSAPGDRRDEDIVATGQAAAGKFDLYILRRDDARRGRGHDEVPRMLRQALLARGVPEGQVVVIPDEQEAIDYALRAGRPGDLLLIFADALTRSWKQVLHFAPEAGGATARVSMSHAPAMAVDAAVGVPAIGTAAAGTAAVRSGNGSPAAASSTAASPAAFDEDSLIRDGRGVRLARDADD